MGLLSLLKITLEEVLRYLINHILTLYSLSFNKAFFFLTLNNICIYEDISPSSSSYMKRTDVDKNIFHKLDSDVIRFSRVGKVMIMSDLNANINNKEHGLIANESADDLDDFCPIIIL